MRDILGYIETRIAQLDRHPLFAWLDDDRTPLKDRLLILPSIATVAIGFRDVNKWVLRYPKAATDLERGINIHTFEDQTHSRLFMEDWRRLGLDVSLGWQASDTLWWLFLAEPNEVNRRHGSYFLSLPAADRHDPLLRFAQAEVAEQCARDLFFKHASRVAGQLADETGVQCLYLGQHHIDAEGEGAEGLFETQVLDGPRRERAQQLVDTMFVVFTEIFDSMLSYAQTFVATGDRPRRPATSAVASAAAAPAAGEQARPSALGLLDGPVHPTQQELAALLRERVEGSGRHPFGTWMNHRGPRLPAEQALSRFFPMWAVDVVGTHDLVQYVLRYREPSDGDQRALNAWADALADRSEAYLADWRTLKLDEQLGWAASETFEFCYLDRLMDTFRHNRVKLIELGSAHTDPVVRMWLLAALDATADVFSAATTEAAAKAEQALDGRLDYLTGRYRTRPQVNLAQLAQQPMTADQRAAAGQIIDMVFDAFDEQLDLSLDVALSDYLELR